MPMNNGDTNKWKRKRMIFHREILSFRIEHVMKEMIQYYQNLDKRALLALIQNHNPSHKYYYQLKVKT